MRYRCDVCGKFVKDKFIFGLLHLCLTDEEVAAQKRARIAQQAAAISQSLDRTNADLASILHKHAGRKE